ncbi:hypothetical protein [Ferroacidibacillus organovorans]|uniref:Uncharacterized protein n=1 Tax=Ferroacidibacillus organovorans TaxID=1765683 RepID=A0A1V4ETD0_9BACL|nr:hypothetical protein [Ferroacidibacillus organovorans]OPG16122.1 hypothetical protein B2M26_08765 [Ferroacidibacillus organovorans]
MNMTPYIDPAVVHSFHVMLFQWSLMTLASVLLMSAAWWLLGYFNEDTDAPRRITFDTHHPFRQIWMLIRHRVGHTPKARVVLGWGLGTFWLIDGILQAQPAMPNNGFVQDVLAPSVIGQPPWYLRILGWNIQFWSDYPVGADVFSVILQVGIGLCLLLAMDRVWGRIGLWVSIVWGLGIWFLGEGMGGILTGSATWLSGSPGSVLFYVCGAIFLLLPESVWRDGRVIRLGNRVIGGIWILATFAQALPTAGYWTGQGLSRPFLIAASMPQPSFFSDPIHAMAVSTLHHPWLWNAVFVAIMFILGVFFWFQRVHSWVLVSAFVWLYFSWWMGQDFGVMGGIGTDPNSAPVFALFIVTIHLDRFARRKQAPIEQYTQTFFTLER